MATILVLDDEKEACELMDRILSSKYQVKTFTEEHEAIAYAENNPVDLAILDIKLKTMSGVDVLAKLKEGAPYRKVIMLTGYPTLETARQSISLGADEYLVKPIDIDELESKVKSVLATDKKRAKKPIRL